MSTQLKSYPAYKDSGVPWLAEIPAHWEVDRLKKHARNVVELTGERVGEEIYLALEHVESWTGRLRPSAPDATFDSQVKRFRADDVLFGKLRPYLAKITRPEQDGVCVGEFLVLRPQTPDLASRYLEHLLRSKPVIDAINSSTFGAKMPRADWQFVGNMTVALPPLPEQRAIARYLDHVDRRIRRVIHAKQKLIALLDEQKQAVIHQAVTRGLDPNVRLKPSGVAWLGEVPEHWEVKQLGRFITLQRGFDITKEQQTAGSIPVVSSGGISSYHNQATSAGPGVIVGRKGSAGTVYYVGGVYWAHDTTLWVKEFNSNAPKYVYYVLTNMDLKRFDTGSANPTINRNIVHPELIAFPPPEEQRRIAIVLDHLLEQTDQMIGTLLRQISLLREYRTRLIADVVTGKVDVRAAAQGLPEEVDELEPLGEVEAPAEDEEGIELTEEDEETGG